MCWVEYKDSGNNFWHPWRDVGDWMADCHQYNTPCENARICGESKPGSIGDRVLRRVKEMRVAGEYKDYWRYPLGDLSKEPYR